MTHFKLIYVKYGGIVFTNSGVGVGGDKFNRRKLRSISADSLKKVSVKWRGVIVATPMPMSTVIILIDIIDVCIHTVLSGSRATTLIYHPPP